LESKKKLNVRNAFQSFNVSPKIDGELVGSLIVIPKRQGVSFYLAESADHSIHFLISDIPKSLGGLARVSLQGLSVSIKDWVVAGSSKKKFLDLSLNGSARGGYTEIFLSFLETFCEELESSAQAPFEILTSSLQRWRYFWTSELDVLSDSQLRGLIAELVVFQELLGIIDPSDRVLAAWLGPESGKKDFKIGEIAIEVKSSVASPPTVIVQGLDQLDPRGLNALYLALVSLTSDQGSQTVTLETLIEGVRTALKFDATSLDIFHEKLTKVGYSPKHSEYYKSISYRVAPAEYYLVDDSFPKLIHNSFSPALDRRLTVSTYAIMITGIQPIPLDSIFRE
jgi:hypothetical protein